MLTLSHRIVLICILTLFCATGFTQPQKADQPPTNASSPDQKTTPSVDISNIPAGPKLWNLQEADIISIINEVSQETGKNFIVDPRVQGKITLISSKPIKPEDTYNVFLSILGLLGYSAIQNGDVVKIVPNLESSEMASRVASSKTPGKGDEIVVRVIPLDHVAANQLIPILRPMLPQWSNISIYPPGNVLILVGQASNINRLVEVVRNIDTAASSQIDIIPLKHASAGQVATVLNNLQNAARATGEMPTTFISADDRGNTILLSGNKTARLRLKLLIAQLDSPGKGAKGNTEVVYLRYLQAKTFAPILGKVADNLMGKNAPSSSDSSPLPSSSFSGLPSNIPGMGNPSSNKSSGAPSLANLTNIQAEPSTNALIITAPPALMQALLNIVAKLDVRPAQVLVEGVIVEINQDDLKNIGLTWGGTLVSGGSGASSTDSSVSSGTTAVSPSPFGFPALGAGIVGIIPQQKIQAILSLLQNKTWVNILSTPSIVVLDNHKAILEIGQDVPVQTGSYATTGSATTATPFNTTEMKPVTLKLTVTPQINLGNSVRLKITLKNDSLQNPSNPGLNPIINTSSIDNSVVLESGDIVVLGGLISNNITQTINKVPLLGDIPLIGRLFQDKTTELQKKNLLMFIKPVILHDENDTLQVTNTKYDFIRNVQINWPQEQEKMGVEKTANILPLFKNNIELPKPFAEK